MKILLWSIEWEYPEEHALPEPVELDLSNTNALQSLVLAFGNAIYVEARVVGETTEVLDVVRGIMGSGYEHRDPPAARWLYRPGDECYAPWPEKEASIFICPTPEPHLFTGRDA